MTVTNRDDPEGVNMSDETREAEAERGPASRPYPPGRDPRRKSIALAVALSFMPGLGQIYVGHYQRGFITAFLFASIIGVLSSGGGELVPFLGVALAFLVLYNLIDAARRAMLYNHMLDGLAEGPLPEGNGGPGGSIAGGLALAGIGLLLFLHLRWDWSLVWLEEWWPVGLIAFGAYIAYRGVQARKLTD